MISIKNYLRKRQLENIQSMRLANEDDFFYIKDEVLLNKNKEWFQMELIYIPGAINIEINYKEVTGFVDWDYPYWIYTQATCQMDNILEGKGFRLPHLESDISLDVNVLSKDRYLIEYREGKNVKSRINCERLIFLKSFFYSALEALKVAERFGIDCSKEINILEGGLLKLK
ncbi:hypothetical protein DVR12_17625 [Chitinophaga silvatica]|uniref:Uncharacterized protein n=1 Tax=Chitinophaga silvatica TaxID=2282649 RepID=A0A3E1Y7X1_9BACT|nr:hypothetical protein [Chitinophaga silvatica]RFS21155.1 hypothetical protein DVR12_17625 [Chitinophaga silvatica]